MRQVETPIIGTAATSDMPYGAQGCARSVSVDFCLRTINSRNVGPLHSPYWWFERPRAMMLRSKWRIA